MSTIDKIRTQAEKRAEEVAAEVTKQASALSTEASKLTNPSPAYAVVGLTDVVVERARAAGGAVAKIGQQLRPQVIGEQVTKAAADVPTQVTKVAGEVSDRVTRTAGEVTKQVEAAPGVAAQRAAGRLGQIQDGYEGLAARGQSLVTRVRKQAATQDLLAQVDNAVKHGKALLTTTRKGATQTTSAAKATVTTGRRQVAEKAAEAIAPAPKPATTTPAAKKPATKKATAKKAPARKPATTKATTTAAKGTGNSTVTTPAKADAKASPARKPATKKATATKAPARKPATKKATTAPAAKATQTAAKRTATTAANRADETVTAAKSAATSASKVAEKAVEATTDAAAKVGN